GMSNDQKPAKPSQQNPEQDNAINPRLKEPIGPGGDRGGVDEPGSSASKNPGQTNPAHNTPRHVREDHARQHDLGQPGQGQTQSYPGVKGPKAHELRHDSDIDREGVEQVRGAPETRINERQDEEKG